VSARSSVQGDRADVRLSLHGASVDFRLVKAKFAEQEQFQAPPTHLRIAGGELALIPPQDS